MALMELLPNSTISRDLLIHRLPIHFPAKFSLVTLKKTNAGSKLLPSSIKFPLQSPSSLNRPLYQSSRFRISAQFGQSTSRQNYFRKKLTQFQQVSDIWDFSKSPHENVDSNSFDVNFEVISNAGEKSSAILESKSTGDSVLWISLEGWDEKYKDPEFWGKGAEPIFTVFLRYNGEVERVVLNENELLRRSGVDPVLYKEGFVKGLAQVNSRILFASVFAREIEEGRVVVVLPGNSSAVKLISSTKDPSITHNPKIGVVSSSWAKITTMLVGIVFCSWFITILIELMPVAFWLRVIMKPFSLWSTYRRGKSDKEILRRSIENRMSGKVEIKQDSEKSDVLSVESPPLDMEEELDDMIQEMARGSRELEKTQVLSEITGGEDDHQSQLK